MFGLKSWNQIKRSQKVILVLFKYGLNPKLTPPKKLRLALEELGPTFVKFGQILSTRPDFLPPEFIKELEKLQDQAPPFSTLEAQKIIEKELNQPLEKIFKKFEPKPIAAASLSQVHKAILPNDEVVAVKIQRPGIEKIIESDLEILKHLASFLENHLPHGWVYQPKLIISELKKAIKKEIDFINEAYNFERFKINFKNFEGIKVPKIYWEFSTSKVLTMEFVEGIKVSEITQEKYKNVFDPKKVAKRGAEAILKQILEDGFFHADPHPANLLVQPPATIVILDAGMVGHLDEITISKIGKLIQAITDKNLNQIVECLESLGVIMKEIDKNQFRQDLKELLDRYFGLPLKRLEIRRMSEDLLKLMVSYHLTLPSNLVLMIKALSMEETIGKKLDPDFNMISAAKPFIKKLWQKKFTSKELLKKSRLFLQESLELIEKVPHDLTKILQQFEEDKIKINFDSQRLEKVLTETKRSNDRISLSLIISALIIGSSLILEKQPHLGIIGYLLASFLALVLITSIFKSNK